MANVTKDPDGDLTLVVGARIERTEATKFVVESRILARSSPVLKRMVDGKFQESRSSQSVSEPWVIELPDDKPSALAVLLQIMHLQFHAIPTALTISRMYDLMVLAEKYDMTRLLKPWSEDWWTSLLDSDESTKGKLQLMYIAWQLGEEETVQELSLEFTRSGTLGPEGELFIDGIHIRSHGIIEAADLFECITQARETAISRGTSIITNAVNNLRGFYGQGGWRCTKSLQRARGGTADLCRSTLLGQIIYRLDVNLALIAMGQPDASPYKDSFNALEARIDYLAYDGTFPMLPSSEVLVASNSARWGLSAGYRHVISHGECSIMPGIRRKFTQLSENLEDPLTEKHRAQLERNKKRAGW